MDQQLFDQAYWEEAWKKDPHTSLKKMKKAGLGTYQSPGFAQWAQNFDASSFTPEATKRTDRILKWVEQYVGSFEGVSVLDIGAASGVFSIPFAKRGGIVSSLEPALILNDLLKKNADANSVQVKPIHQAFEDFDPEQESGYDLVFASMCPAITDWNAVKKAIRLSNKYVYISLMAGPKENLFVDEILEVLELEAQDTKSSDMVYLLHLLYLNDYTYQSLIEKHRKTVMMDREDVLNSLNTWLIDFDITLTDEQKSMANDYIKKQYGEKIPVTTGGKFGKVLIEK